MQKEIITITDKGLVMNIIRVVLRYTRESFTHCQRDSVEVHSFSVQLYSFLHASVCLMSKLVSRLRDSVIQRDSACWKIDPH